MFLTMPPTTTKNFIANGPTTSVEWTWQGQKKGGNPTFSVYRKKGPTNKKFLFLNISNSNRNSALPHMSPTYPEKMSLLGPSSWEEIAHVQTDRPQEFTPLLTCLCIIHAISFCPFFIPNSLAALGSWITLMRRSLALSLDHSLPSSLWEGW